MQGHAHQAKNSFTFIEENETDELPQLRTKHEVTETTMRRGYSLVAQQRAAT